MKFWYKLILMTILGLPISLFAQTTQWSLRDCIDYARRENIQVKKSQLTSESSVVDIKQAKAQLFPSLTGNISQSFNNSKDATNNYDSKSQFSGQYGLNTSWTLFNGKQNINGVKSAKIQKDINDLSTEQQQWDIEVSITQVYLQLLYARESIKNNENIVEASSVQLAQTKDFLDVGNITKAEYSQVESQYSSDKYNLVLAQNTFDSYLLQLKQLLELDIDVVFDPQFPNIGNDDVETLVPAKNQVYAKALALMPEIKQNKLGLSLAEVAKSTAKGGYMPTISLNGSIGTNNIWNSGNGGFGTQLDNNFNQYVGVSVSIPIFDNRKNRSNVQKANIEYETAKLNYTQSEKDLLKTVENLYLDAVSGQSKFDAAKDKLTSSQLSYDLVKEQYALGMRNTVELVTEQNNYANALQDLLQAKYTALLSLKLLNYYQGEVIDL